MKKIKKVIMKKVSRIKYFFVHDIPTCIDFLITNKIVKNELKRNNIDNAKPFNMLKWHFGYKYYIGLYNGKKVFIKYNSNYKWIEYEYNNFKYLKDNSKFIYERIPLIYLYKKIKKHAFLVEEFFSFSSLDYYVENKDKINFDVIYEELKTVLNESQKINFKFLDLNPTNIFINDDCSKVYLIDLGFSNLNKNNINFIDNMKLRKMIINNLNDFSRLDVGVIDDAYSIIQICKKIDSRFISNKYEKWMELNKMMGISVFNKKELYNEN